jgi:hypothetical protein
MLGAAGTRAEGVSGRRTGDDAGKLSLQEKKGYGKQLKGATYGKRALIWRQQDEQTSRCRSSSSKRCKKADARCGCEKLTEKG